MLKAGIGPIRPLPERTIREARLFEFGPVVYPANPGATAGIRGLTDYFHDRHRERAVRSGLIPPTPPAESGTGVGEPPDPREHSEASPTRTATHLLALTGRLRA